MCDNCNKRERRKEWVRNKDGTPKRTPCGSYMMVCEMGAYYGFAPEEVEHIREMLKEIEHL